MGRRFQFVLIVSLASTGIAPQLHAQRAGVAAHSIAPMRGATAHAHSLVSVHNSAAFRGLPRSYYPFGDLTSAFYPGDYSLPGDSSEPQPSVIGPPIRWAMSNAPEETPRPPVDPLIIELQGDRYVRVVENAQNDNSQSQDRSLATVENISVSNPAHRNGKAPVPVARVNPSAAPQLSPAVLVFRDGHSEEIRDYSIIDGVIYARGNLYTDGYWNKKISVATLNIPETFKSNQARGVAFLLPSSPNEVITRP